VSHVLLTELAYRPYTGRAFSVLSFYPSEKLQCVLLRHSKVTIGGITGCSDMS